MGHPLSHFGDQVFETLGDGFELDGGQHDVVAVHDNNGPGAAPLCGVDQMPFIAGFVFQTLHG